jgi:hypothetical protein
MPEPATLATIGTLLAITNSVIEVIKGLGSFLSGSSAKEKLKTTVAQLYGRIDALGVQLAQCEELTRMVPAWLELAKRMPLWKKPDSLDDREAQLLDDDLRSLIHESMRDHFSGTFFNSRFDQLPDIPLKLEIFRERLRTLDRTISAVQPSHPPSLIGLWPQITTQFNDARNTAFEIQHLAEDLQGRLIQELRDAARQGLAELPKA